MKLSKMEVVFVWTKDKILKLYVTKIKKHISERRHSDSRKVGKEDNKLV